MFNDVEITTENEIERLRDIFNHATPLEMVGYARTGALATHYVVDLDLKDRFRVSPLVRRALRNKKEQFGFGLLGAAVYFRTYSRLKADGSQEQWADTVIRVVEGIMTVRKWWYLRNNLKWDEGYWQGIATQMAHAIFDFKMLPPGRGLWAAGSEWMYERGSAALYNPLSGDTLVATDRGAVPIETLVGREANFLTAEGWQKGTVNCYGEQAVQEIIFAPMYKGATWRKRVNGRRKRVVATPNHGWPVVGQREKKHDLTVGDLVPAVAGSDNDVTPTYKAGVRHGLFFADGTRAHEHSETYTANYNLRLCKEKANLVSLFEEEPFKITYPESCDDDPFIAVRSAVAYKELPEHVRDAEYLRGFIDGWLAGDGSVQGRSVRGNTVTLASTDSEALDWLEDHAVFAGLVVHGRRKDKSTRTNYGERKKPLEVVTMTRGEAAWLVESITPLQTKIPVYCATVPNVGYFALANGVYTGNCFYLDVTKLSEDAAHTMDFLMCGIGAGHNTQFIGTPQYTKPSTDHTHIYVIPDTREGWVESLRRLIASYEDGRAAVYFDYSQIRPEGSPIRGFGGTASGAGPLRKLHERVRGYLDRYVAGEISAVRLTVDVMNAIGACVVAGNVRRSAEISLGDPTNDEFVNLKNYEMYPERAELGWMSNNSVVLDSYDDFRYLPRIAERVRYNGEPGIFNLVNIQKYGRYGERLVDAATGANPCVTGDTRILTDEGYFPIEDLVGQNVFVWTGDSFSMVQPRVTGVNQPILKITFDDGTSLKTTPYHVFHTNDGTVYKPKEMRKEARELQVGDRLWKFNMPVVRRGSVLVGSERAYTQGVYAGDGFVNQERQRSFVYLYGEKKALIDGMEPTRVYETPTRTLAQVEPEHEKTFVPHNWYYESRLAWLAGLFDTDGTITKDGNIQVTSVNEGFLLETRLMLTTLGVQAKVTKNRDACCRLMPDGRGGMKEYDCQSTYRLMLSASDVVKLRDLGLQDYLRRIDLTSVSPNRDARRFVRVASIEEGGIAPKVYCFTEHTNHTGTFEGIVTGQCAEIPLEDAEVCNLVEVFPTRCVDDRGRFDEATFQRTLQLATLYASTVSLLPTHNERTNAVIARNRRIGVSLSGIADWMETNAATDVISWLNRGYDVVRGENRRLAREAGVPESVRVTTVKPSGTVSLLAGVSSGMHLPPFSRYLRRVRIGQQSAIVPILQNAGVPNEPDIYSDNTLVFEFPVDQGKVRGQKDVSVWAKAQTVVMLQKFWADNMVSNTLSFDPVREGNQIEDLVTFTAPFIKTISLLPLLDEGAVYEQSPIEQITLAEVQRRQKEIGGIDWSQFGGSDGQDSKFCSNDSCEV